MLKKTDNFVWSEAADKAFEDLKRQLLAAPINKEPLLLYVAANARAVSIAIVVERKELGKEYRFNGRFIISARYSLSQSRGIRIGRSWCMEFLRQAAAQALFSGSLSVSKPADLG